MRSTQVALLESTRKFFAGLHGLKRSLLRTRQIADATAPPAPRREPTLEAAGNGHRARRIHMPDSAARARSRCVPGWRAAIERNRASQRCALTLSGRFVIQLVCLIAPRFSEGRIQDSARRVLERSNDRHKIAETRARAKRVPINGADSMMQTAVTA